MKRLNSIIFFMAIGVLSLFLGCNNKNTGAIRFNDYTQSGIHFSNDILESDSLNYYNFPYIYMGGGVAIGDINNDGLSDVFFTGNMVKNKLYLNKGNLNFEDISPTANVEGDNRWYTGVTMVDINLDGWLDIYVCVSGKKNRKNQLYINNGDLTFTEMAEKYGIADESPSIQSTFFDYDNDGDLDVFVGNYPIIPLSLGNAFYFEKMANNEFKSSAHLYKNNGDGSFTDVTTFAGVQNYGLTLGVVASDLNNDGWQDLYISNDFQVPDYLYLNNKDGTFSEKLKTSVQHTAMYGMGVDASDFNNDGLIDLAQLDMAPDDYKRAKVNMATMAPESFWQIADFGGHYQYMQNSLQVNNGNNDLGEPVFSEISRLSGISTTDWSWGVLFADLNNNGNKDLLITNGIRKDVNNNDVIKADRLTLNPVRISIDDLPSQPLHNYIFQNTGDFQFKNVGDDSGFDFEGFSNGITYGDLDNDGDLDVVINNLDDQASLFENKADGYNNYLKIKIVGPEKNPLGLGTRILAFDGDQTQTQELTLTRGFQSSVEPIVHFGLGKKKIIEKLTVKWPDGSEQILEKVQANQLLIIKKDSKATVKSKNSDVKSNFDFIDITHKSAINYKHQEDQYDDFNFEPLLPHKNSTIGPGLTVGYVNGDGLEDFFIGNAAGNEAALFVQNENQTFTEINGPWKEDVAYEDTGALLFDADNDGDLDLYVVSGGNNPLEKDTYYQDRLYTNTQGTYTRSTNTLPKITDSGQVVIASDFDDDGDKDLFIGGRIIPGNYPYPANSRILRNDGGIDEKLRFTDVTQTIAPDFLKLGLVTSAVWTDFNNDKKPDLIIAGEWMPIRFFENRDSTFKEVTNDVGMQNTQGWWYSLETADVDKDGDLDILAGNLGLNYKYKASEKAPFEIYANDFDENGTSDIVLSYIKKGKELPVRGKECSSQQVPAIGVRFKTYESFAEADLSDIYGSGMLKKSLKYEAKTFAHHWFEKLSNGKYKLHELPQRSQFSSINDIEIINENTDMLLAGNLYSSEIETPRNDAGMGLLLRTESNRSFNAIPPHQSGLMVRGEVKAIKSIRLGKNGKNAYLFAINNDSLRLILKQ